MPQKKKLSLDEARAMFSDPNKDQRPRSARNDNSSGGKRTGAPRPRDPEQIQTQITRLERKIEFDNLSPEEEQKIMSEIGRLEDQLKQVQSN